MIIEIDQDIGAFLEHHGVKGQKWGVRRAKQINAARALRGKGPVKASQTVGNKATRGAAYVAGYLIGGAIGSTFGGAASNGNVLVSSLAGTAGNVVGVVTTNKILKNVGGKRLADV